MINKCYSENITCRAVIVAVLASVLAACGGGGGAAPSPPVSPPPPPPVVNSHSPDMSAENVVAGSAETGSAVVTVTHGVTAEEIGITVSLNGISADSVSLREGFAGETGDEVFVLTPGSNANEWQLATTALPAAIADQLDAGALYILVTTAASPDGALRGQILPDGISVARIELAAEQVAGATGAAGSGTAWLTFNDTSSALTVHIVTVGLPDADAATVNRSPAGTNGPVLESLSQDSLDPDHWFLDTTVLSVDVSGARNDGSLYVELTTPAEPGGAVRGQLVPDGAELVITDLSDDAVVASKFAAKLAIETGRIMTTIDGTTMTSHVNLFSIADADGVHLHQAPAGQNGPIVAQFEQDINDPLHWSLTALPLDAVLMAALNNRTLYVDVSTPTAPDSRARGQIEPAESMAPPDDSAFSVVATEPANASQLDAMPQSYAATLNRGPLGSSVDNQSILIEASGGDGSFGDGNEVAITPASISVADMTITIGLEGAGIGDDVYRVSIFGDGANGVVDTSGIPLDGDGDGTPGGTFESAFEVSTPVLAATFTRVQNEIFTPNCTASGCHSGSNPPDGLLLTQGNAWANVVNVNSVQMPALKRIAPADPDNSYLVRKVQATGIVASRMPLGQPPLSQAQIDLLREWVTNGALND